MSEFKEKQILLNKYRQKLATMVSDLDFKRAFGDGVKVLKYSELSNYHNINDLLPNAKDYVFILIETKKNSGHWTCLLKYDDVYEWFDSYGIRPDGELNFISKAIKELLGENHHELTRLIKTIPKGSKMIYNKRKLQKLAEGINTCGRWCILRASMLNIGFDLKEFVDFIERNAYMREKPSDILVCDFTN